VKIYPVASAENVLTNVRRHFFTERIAFIWNILPPSVVDLRNLSLFKKTIYNAKFYLHGIN